MLDCRTTLPLSKQQCSHTAIGPLAGALLTAQANQTQVSSVSIHLAQLFPFPTAVRSHTPIGPLIGARY